MMPAAAQARTSTGWQRPVQLAAPFALDVFGTRAAVSAQGTSAVGFGVTDVDVPEFSAAFTLTRSPGGRLTRPQQIAGAKQVLAVGWLGRNEIVLTGTADPDQTCCSSAGTSQPDGRGAHTIVSALAGATDGRLVSVMGRLLAVVGTERGVWAAQSDGRGRFGPTHQLTGSTVLGEIDAIATPLTGSVIGWAATDTPAIWIARGSVKAAPQTARRVIRVPAGHAVDDFALAPAPASSGGATALWIESWNDSAFTFHSVVMSADLTSSPRRRQLSSSRELAAGLAVGGDAAGDQAVAWKRCTTTGTCALRAVLRPIGRSFGSVQRLPEIDASEVPALAVSPTGETLLGWVQNGHVLATGAQPGATRLNRVHTVSTTNYATDLAVTFGPGTTALATWTQGTLNQAVMGAVYVGH